MRGRRRRAQFSPLAWEEESSQPIDNEEQRLDVNPPQGDSLRRLLPSLGVDRRDGDSEESDPAREPMLRAQHGDLDAFRSLVEMFQNRVMRVMVSVLRCDRSTAEDLSQEVFMRVHKGLPGFDGEVRFAAWLHKISRTVTVRCLSSALPLEYYVLWREHSSMIAPSYLHCTLFRQYLPATGEGCFSFSSG